MISGQDLAVRSVPLLPRSWRAVRDDSEPASSSRGVVDPTPSETPTWERQPLHSLRQANLVSTRRAPGTCSLWKILKDTGAHLFEGSQRIVGGFLGNFAMLSATSYFSPNIQKIGDSAATYALLSTVTGASTSILTQTATTISKGRLSEIEALRETYLALIASSRPLLRRYPAGVRAAVENLDRRVTEAFSRDSKSVVWHEQKLRHRESILMSIPYYAKEVAWHSRGDVRDEIIAEKLEKLVRSYPVESAASLTSLIRRIRGNSLSAEPSRIQAYLYGASGTGKSRFVKELANALDLPLVELRLRANNLDNFHGSRSTVEALSETMTDVGIIGELAQSLIGAGYTNPIVLIDNLNASNEPVMSVVETLLDPTRTTIPIESFAIELDWRRATVICTGVTKPVHPSLTMRMTKVSIPSMQRDRKKLIVFTRLSQAIPSYLPSLGEGGLTRLKKTCLRYVDFLLDNDELPGTFGAGLAAESLVHYVAAALMEGRQVSSVSVKAHIVSELGSLV